MIKRIAKRKWFWLVAALAVVMIYRSVLLVDEKETVIVTQFGRPVSTLWPPGADRDGDAAPGLHFKMPHQSVIRLDRRLQMYDPRPSEFLTADKKNINLDVFVCWRIADPEQFRATVTNMEGAQFRIHDIVFSELGAKVGENSIEALLSVDPNEHQLDRLLDEVTERCAHRAAPPNDTALGCGIEIVDVRLKRITLPSQVRESVFRRMRAERASIAGRYRAEGEQKAKEIRDEADTARRKKLADAEAKADEVRGDAEKEATETYTAAHGQDPAFFRMMRTLDADRKILDRDTTIILSTDSELLRYLTGAAVLEPPPEETATQPEN